MSLLRSTFRAFICIALLVICMASAAGQVPFSKGVNLTNWFQASAPSQIQFSKFTKKDFERIQSLGCDVIRLPINLHAMTSGEPDYTLDPLFLYFLDNAVTWAEELHLHLILDNHTFDPAVNTDPDIGPVLVKVWTQMAEHYKDRTEYIYYEVLNEPHGIADNTWGSIQQTVIDAIRSKDTEHFIIVGPAEWNSYNSLSQLPVYTDNKLIYTFHFYDPFIFTHQGASWTDPSMVSLGGVPFPYRAASMPATPADLKGSWIEGALGNYATEGTAAKVKSLIDVGANFRSSRNVPVFCGEFGVYMPNSENNDRVAWYKLVHQYFEEKNIPWTIWDYTGGFGVFEKNSNELFDYDLNVPLLEALEFTVPEQQVYTRKPVTKGFILYDDYLREGIIESSYANTGMLDYYNQEEPKDGTYCIHWTGMNQYGTIALDFKPDLDLSLLKNNDHELRLFVRGNTPAKEFDIRFVDTKTNSTDHPWRMGKTISNALVPWDNSWQEIHIPLAEMEEKGSYDNAYFPPEGKFDWTAIDRLEIVAEHHPLTGISFWFDNIEVFGEEVPYEPPVLSTSDDVSSIPLVVYPNPATDHITVDFSLRKSSLTTITLYSATGKKIQTLSQKNTAAGSHSVLLKIGDTAPGLYLVEVATQKQRTVKKFMRK